MARKTAKTYHHGDLREALVKAGRAILEEQGVAALTLRACARKAGVSHAAPQHHFASVADLLADIAATGFEDFVAALDAGSATASLPAETLKDMARCYVAFAENNPAIYNLMFGDRIPKTSARLQTSMMAAWDQLESTVRAAVGPDDVQAKAIQVWSLTHGFSTLSISRRMPPGTDAGKALDHMLDRLPAAISSPHS
jgi:AcrR family transcriptional regulator